MDGNRRWAREHGYQPWVGHQKGTEPVREAIELCVAEHIPYLTLYAFSLENFKRPQEELHYLLDVIAKELFEKELDSLIEQGVRVQFIGDESKFPDHLRSYLDAVEARTADGQNLTLNILFCYGGRQELTAAVKTLCQRYAAGDISDDDFSPKLIKQHLWTRDIPDPELVIRTGGHKRLSNFLSFQSAYSELCFMDTYWPDITKKDLKKAIKRFTKTHRKFGA
jgi:undecaprenyl diphosphate synthase